MSLIIPLLLPKSRCPALMLTDNLVDSAPIEMKFTVKSIGQEINVVFVWNDKLSDCLDEVIVQRFCLM